MVWNIYPKPKFIRYRTFTPACFLKPSLICQRKWFRIFWKYSRLNTFILWRDVTIRIFYYSNLFDLYFMEDNFLSCQLIYKRLSHNIMLLKNTTILLVVQIICFGKNKQKLLIILYLPMLHVYQKISCFTLLHKLQRLYI